MDWLLHNWLSDLPGPSFLVLYGIVTAVVVLHSRGSLIRGDRSLDLGSRQVLSKADPREIAYLRGGADELTRFLVFDLLRRGYLQVVNTEARWSKAVERRIVRVQKPQGKDQLSYLERVVCGFFEESRKAHDVFQPGKLAATVDTYSLPLRESLCEEQLISHPERSREAWVVGLSGSTVVLALGLFKLVVALSKGRHNLAFLIVFAVIGLIALAIACRVPRITARGRDYLTRLQQGFEGLKQEASLGRLTECDGRLSLVTAVFGVGALAGTPFGDVPKYFSTAGSGGGFGTEGGGGGCGGGGCGGGGCGGGGCGGGGCGGCGGG